MTVGRRTLALTAVGCAMAAGGGVAFAATQHGSTASRRAKTVHVTRPAAAQHHCPHMGMARDTASSSNL